MFHRLVPCFTLFAFFIVRAASAQPVITNGSFENGYTGWTLSGAPTVAGTSSPSPTQPLPIDGTKQALINSTAGGLDPTTATYGSNCAVSAAQLNSDLATTLPSSANGAPTNGEAIRQTFTCPASTLSFSYAYQSRESPRNGYDETGYVLDGVFHVLADTSTPGEDKSYVDSTNTYFVWGLPYQTISIPVAAGTHTIGFVTYNTSNTSACTGIFLDNVSVTNAAPITYTPLSTAQATSVSGVNVGGNNSYIESVNGVDQPVSHGFYFTDGRYEQLVPSNSSNTVVAGISGTNVAGSYVVLDTNTNTSQQHGFFYDGSNFTTLDPSDSASTTPTAISGTNVAGSYVDNGDAGSRPHGFFYDGTNFTVLDPADSVNTQATAIDGTNVAGIYTDNGDNGSRQHGFFYNGASFTTVDPAGSTSTQVTGISGTNVVGWYLDSQSVRHAFLHDVTTNIYTTLDPTGSSSAQATAVSNISGGISVVGTYLDSQSVQHGFFYNGTTTTVDPQGSTLTQLTGVSGANVVGNYTDSASVQHGFLAAISLNAAVAPTFSPVPGTFTSAQMVTITPASGTTVYYTTDGSTPSSTNGTLYTTPVSIASTTTLNAVVIESGMANSTVTSGVYTINLPTAVAPAFNPLPGTYTSSTSVTITSTTSGASIYYTTDGSTPSSTNGTLYTNPVPITATTTLNAIATASGMSDSTVTSGVYTIVVADPTFTPAPGTYSGTTPVTISTTTTGASIYYTTDGTTPSSTNGTLYANPVPISSNTTFNAIAVETGLSDSTVISGGYTITLPVADPTFSPGPGIYSSAQSVTISTTTAGASIRYTTDGTTIPTSTTGTLYSGAVSITNSATLKAIAFENGMSDSNVVSGVYSINTGPTQTYGDWANQYGLTPGNNGPTDVPQNDGVPNLLKYLYDIDPTVPIASSERSALPILGTTTVNGTNYLTLTYRQYSQFDFNTVQVSVQASNDLVTWTTDTDPNDRPVATGTTDTSKNPPDPYMQVRVPIIGPKQFIRLQVTQ